jgi:hypothetical protein
LNNVNEIFALPIGLKPIPVFGSLRLFTSDSLKKSYIESMINTPKMSSVSDKLSKLVNDELIIPCFLTKGIISTIIFKMFPTDRARNDEQFFREEMRNAFGFYESGSKRIYILISNQINKLGFADNEKLASISIHESAHMAASKKPSKFIGTFNKILFDYYSLYFTHIFSLKRCNDKLIEDIIQFLFVRFEKSTSVTINKLNEYHNLILNFRDMSTAKNSFDKVVDDLFVAISLFVKSTSQFVKNMNKFIHITDALQMAYDGVFHGRDPGNIPIQELLFPSEVIAVGSEIGNNKNIINGIFKLL